MNKPGSKQHNQDNSETVKPVYGNNPVDPGTDPVETDEEVEPNDVIQPGDPASEPVKSDGMNDPDNPSDNTLASAGDYYEEPVMEQAGDDLSRLQLNPGDKGTQAHQGHVRAFAQRPAQAMNPSRNAGSQHM